MKRPERRTILKVLLLLAAGATLNVAVAWGLAVADGSPIPAVSTTKAARNAFLVDGRAWGVSSFESNTRCAAAWVDLLRFRGGVEAMQFGDAANNPQLLVDLYSKEMRSGLLDGASILDKVPGWGTIASGGRLDEDAEMVLDWADGWPARSLWGYAMLFGDPAAAEARQVWVWPSSSSNVFQPDFRAIPLSPLWPGFAVNTLFYAGVLWVLFCGPFALRRMIRRRRGRCAQCAYPVGTSEVCTECGHDLGRRQ